VRLFSGETTWFNGAAFSGETTPEDAFRTMLIPTHPRRRLGTCAATAIAGERGNHKELAYAGEMPWLRSRGAGQPARRGKTHYRGVCRDEVCSALGSVLRDPSFDQCLDVCSLV
jgi:hypothetical protein